MTLGIIGRKIGMTHQFDEKGNHVPITVVQAGPCSVVQKKTMASDKYNAIQLGFEDKKDSRANKPELGHFLKKKLKPKKFLKEIRLTDDEIKNYNEGDEVTVKIFENQKFVDVVGTSKGRGFAGVIKRHNFHMPKQTHGTHEKFRHGGSLGCRFPQRVVKGKKMAGHYGNERSTVQNLSLYAINPEDNLLLIKGAIPGPTNGIVLVKSALKKKS